MSVAHAEPVTQELDAARQFDFWLGEWDCSWSDESGRHLATNSVYLDLGGVVVVENFDGRPSLDFQGLSFSVYDCKAHCWKQTWVDSQAGYLDFVGGFADGVMELRREGELDDAGSIFRMRWENIERDSFDWSWQRSDDGGETWNSLWEIEYTRVV